jgi:hypothetical protein
VKADGGLGCSDGSEMARSILRMVLRRGGTPALAHKENEWLRHASSGGTDGDEYRGKAHRMVWLVRRRGPGFEHGVARSPVTVEDGWTLVGEGQWLGDSTRSSTARWELGDRLCEEVKGSGTSPQHWPYRG